MALEKIPATIEEITPEWLTLALRSTGVIRNVSVTSANKALVAVQGSTGPLVRVTLSCDTHERGAPSSLIAKLTPSDADLRNLLGGQGMYEREIRFYEEIASDTPVPTPKHYYSARNVATHEYILLIEDLQNATLVDHLTGCSTDEAELAIKSIALLHARYWGRANSSALGWVPAYHEIGPSRQEHYVQQLPAFLEKFQHRAPEYLLDVCERFGPNLKTIFDQMSQDPITLIHGDFGLENMFFGTTESSQPLTVIDWQTIKRGKGVTDVGYFLGWCIDEQDRRSIENDLLKTYWSVLREHGVDGYSFDQLLHDYRLSFFNNIQVMVPAVARLDLSFQNWDELSTVVMRRLSAALEDHDVGTLLS